ncbi:MAG: hemolysin, partial [Actinomycetia bacterium]|nr:hemolysin [Actinomycetes bacterium]
AVMDGRSGALLWEGGAGKGAYPTHPEVGYHTVIADLDGDGLQEVITGRTLYDANGNALCGFSSEEDDGFTGVADLDLDGVGEVVSIGGGVGRVIEADCTVTATFALVGGGNGGPPTIADYDTDGVPEIGVAEADTYTVYEADGTVLWSMPVDDASSHVTGSVVFDFEGDARPEVVYADETRLWVFDGLTGAVRLEDANHASRTLHEFPTVADVDADGQTEIIVPCGGGHEGENQNGLYILGSESGSWVPSRQVWNQHAYSINNINDDLTLPTEAVPTFSDQNSWHSQIAEGAGVSLIDDLTPDIVDVCDDPCGDTVQVLVRLRNRSGNDLAAGVPMALYGDVGGELEVWATTETT